VINGIDVKGTTLDIFVDADQFNSMDDTLEVQMKAQALKRWTAAWKSDHPGRHGQPAGSRQSDWPALRGG